MTSRKNSEANRPTLSRLLFGIELGVVVLFIAIQFVPYGRNHINPPTQSEPKWDSPQTRALVQRACFDCHSNETVWPWYSNIAPVSWLVQHDVDAARGRLNFSEWNQPQRETRGAASQVQRGRMPQWYYALLHPGAKLSTAETQSLVQGLSASLAERQLIPTLLSILK